MPLFGYRVFVVELLPGSGQSKTKFSETGSDHYRVIAARILSGMRGQTLLEERRADLDEEVAPDSGESSNPLAGRKALAMRVVHVEDDVIYGEVLVGTFGDHEKALVAPGLVEVRDQDPQDPNPAAMTVDLTGRAPARRYRFVANFPADGSKGVLAVEDISRSCPVDLLIRWLKNRSRMQAQPVDRADEAAPAADAGSRAGWRLRATPAIDDEHFNAMIAQGRLNKVELVRHSVSSTGARPKEVLRLTAPEPDSLNATGDLIALARRWVENARDRRQRSAPAERRRLTKTEREAAKAEASSIRRQTDQEAAREMAALLGQDIAELEFDDGWLVIQDGNRTKRISPSRISELFTYELDRDRRPSSVDWYRTVRTTALRLATPLSLNLTWPPTITPPEDVE